MAKSRRQKLIEKIDKEMSRFIRMFHADGFGVCTCVTCGYRAYWKGEGFHMGHFVAKGKGASKVRFLPHNTFPQCGSCNCTGGSIGTPKAAQIAPIRYTKFMQEEFGQDIVDDLIQRKFEVVKYTDDELIEIHKLYKEFADQEERNLI